MNNLVSILIPVYNRESIIAETLHSALNQTHENVEIVIVDNASEDNTWQVIQTFVNKNPCIKAFRNEFNLGPVRNWLRCVEEATGEYGKILWSDDLISRSFIERTLPLFNQNVGFVYSGANIFTGDNPMEGKTRYLLDGTGCYPSSLYIERAVFDKGMPYSPGCAIFRMSDIRKNLLLQIPNKVNSDFSMHAIGNDLLLFLLTAKDYKYFGHVAEPLASFRSHEGSITISAKSGKLPIHYALVSAYFVENNYPQLKNSFASYLKLLRWRYNDFKTYNIQSISDFFHTKYSVDLIFLIEEIILKIIRLFFRAALNLIKKKYN